MQTFKDSFESLNPDFGLSHSLQIRKQPILDVSVDELDSSSHLVKFRSDVELLLYDKSLQTKLGADALRYYLDNLNSSDSSDTSKFSDDELFQLIDPKDVNTITDAYEYARYIKQHSEQVKENYKAMQLRKKSEQALAESLKKVD